MEEIRRAKELVHKVKKGGKKLQISPIVGAIACAVLLCAMKLIRAAIRRVKALKMAAKIDEWILLITSAVLVLTKISLVKE